jgi:hypothetical protein
MPVMTKTAVEHSRRVFMVRLIPSAVCCLPSAVLCLLSAACCLPPTVHGLVCSSLTSVSSADPRSCLRSVHSK